VTGKKGDASSPIKEEATHVRRSKCQSADTTSRPRAKKKGQLFPTLSQKRKKGRGSPVPAVGKGEFLQAPVRGKREPPLSPLPRRKKRWSVNRVAKGSQVQLGKPPEKKKKDGFSVHLGGGEGKKRRTCELGGNANSARPIRCCSKKKTESVKEGMGKEKGRFDSSCYLGGKKIAACRTSGPGREREDAGCAIFAPGGKGKKKKEKTSRRSPGGGEATGDEPIRHAEKKVVGKETWLLPFFEREKGGKKKKERDCIRRLTQNT